jgi:MFS family permease
MRSTRSARPRLVTARFLALGVAALGYFFAEGVLVPAVPRYVAGPLAGDDVAVGLVVGVFSLTALLLRPWAGRLADRRGRAVLMVSGAATYAVAVACYGLADSVSVLVGLRLLTGVGEAFFFVGAVTAMSDLAPEERRGEALSLFSLSLYAGLALGPPVGEAVTGSLGFTATWLLAAAGAGTAVILTLRIGDTRPDVPAPAEPTSTRLIHPAGVVPAILLLTAIWGMASFLAFVPLYALDLGLSGASVPLFGFAAIVIAVRSLGARIPDVLGARRAVRLALGTIAAGLAVIGALHTVPGLLTGTAVMAVGVALATPAIFVLALDGVPASERGAVMGVVSMSLDVALGIGPVTFGIVASAGGRGNAFLVAAGIAAAGLVLALATTRKASAGGGLPDLEGVWDGEVAGRGVAATGDALQQQ